MASFPANRFVLACTIGILAAKMPFEIADIDSESPAMNKIRTSKLLSLVLRHQPEKIGIQLDESG